MVVTNTPDVLTDATAELAMTLILMAARRTGEGMRKVLTGRWDGWTPTNLLGQCEEVTFRAGAWQKGRQEQQMRDWFGNVPDFLITLDADYSPAAMREAVLAHRYELQYVLYVFALHRLLRARLPGYDYARHMGGSVTLFLRGHAAASQGLHADCPPQALIEALDALFSGQAEVACP